MKKVALAALPDPGFEAARKGEPPDGWSVSSRPGQLEYRATVSDVNCASGKQCVVVERTKGEGRNGVGTAAVLLDATTHRGRKIRVTASVRVEGKDPGAKAFLVALTRLDAADFAEAPGASWKKVHVDVDVPAEADLILIGLSVTGAARGVIDDIDVSSAPSD